MLFLFLVILLIYSQEMQAGRIFQSSPSQPPFPSTVSLHTYKIEIAYHFAYLGDLGSLLTLRVCGYCFPHSNCQSSCSLHSGWSNPDYLFWEDTNLFSQLPLSPAAGTTACGSTSPARPHFHQHTHRFDQQLTHRACSTCAHERENGNAQRNRVKKKFSERTQITDCGDQPHFTQKQHFLYPFISSSFLVPPSLAHSP